MNDVPTGVLLVEDDPADAGMILAALDSVEEGSFRVEWISRVSNALERLPGKDIDVVLLDLTLASDGNDSTIVSAVIAMGRTLGQRVIAEGVETQAQLAFLRVRQCDEGQGFHFSRPLSAEDFGRLLVAGNDERRRDG